MNGLKNSSVYALLGVPKSPQDWAKVVIKNTFGVSSDEAINNSKCRKAEVNFPRQVHMVLLTLTGCSLSLSGKPYGKNHSTVLWARNKIKNILEIKYPINEYQGIIRAISEFKTYCPNINLQDMPGPWHDIDFNELRS